MMFDARSAYSARTTGWERYARELATRLARVEDVTLWGRRVDRVPLRLVSDVAAARLPRDSQVHFPTFPPLSTDRFQRLVLTVHDLTLWKYPETASRLGRHYYRPLLERAIPRADAIVTHSESVRDEVVNHFGVAPESVWPIFCGADSVPRATSLVSPRPRPFFLVVGSVEPRKNLARLVKAFEMSRVQRDLELVVVGRLAWGKVPNGVQVLQDVSDEQLAELYGHAEAVIVPSLYEGFGLPVAEALAAQTKVLCSDIPVFHEIAGSHATYFDPRSVEDIAQQLDSFGEIPKVTKAVSAEIKDSYNWDRVAANLVRVYADLSMVDR